MDQVELTNTEECRVQGHVTLTLASGATVVRGFDAKVSWPRRKPPAAPAMQP
jgi:hypothetical protein